MEIVFVLVQPARGENIGAAARALNTMGFSQLRLVRPGSYDPLRAGAVAHASNDILQNAEIFDNSNEALQDCDLVVAATARRRGNVHDYVPSMELAQLISDRITITNRCAILFGGEESGLSNDDLSHAQIITSIPLRRRYPSINLAQAVMIYAYELSPLAFIPAEKKVEELHPESLRELRRKTEALLEDLGYDSGRALYHRVLERVSLVNSGDAKLLHSLLGRIQEILRSHKL